jgi:hypothetical protein
MLGASDIPYFRWVPPSTFDGSSVSTASSRDTISHVEVRSPELLSSGMKVSTFLPAAFWWYATFRILSRYVFELRVKAIILVGSFSRTITRESANRCSAADLERSQHHHWCVRKAYNGYSKGVKSPARKAQRPVKVFKMEPLSPPELISLSDIWDI